MLAIEPLEIFVRLRIVLPKFFDYILAYIRMILLDFPSNLKLIFRWHLRHLSTLSHQIEYELRDVSSGNGDVLDGAADDVSLRTRNNVGDTVTRIDNGTRERAVGDAIR